MIRTRIKVSDQLYPSVFYDLTVQIFSVISASLLNHRPFINFVLFSVMSPECGSRIYGMIFFFFRVKCSPYRKAVQVFKNSFIET